MNKFYTILAAILLTTSTFAQSPEKMSYQAVVRNSSDALVTNQAVGMRISILQTTATGTAVYVETQTPTTNINGLLSLEIGTGTPVTGTFAGIDWATGPYFIKTETDPTGSTTYTITGTSQLMSVPYALYAKNGQAAGTAAGQMIYWNGTAWVNVAPGTTGQTLTYCNGVPTWGPCSGSIVSIGDNYQGGIVAYILQPGDPGYDVSVQHGLIAAPSDQIRGAVWGCSGTIISGADGTALGTGNQNTIDIIAGCASSGIAARICGDLVLNGYSDWYLPSKDELNKLYVNRVAIGGFEIYYYWSSSEWSSDWSWRQDFLNGLQGSPSKSNLYNVRAVRAF